MHILKAFRVIYARSHSRQGDIIQRGGSFRSSCLLFPPASQLDNPTCSSVSLEEICPFPFSELEVLQGLVPPFSQYLVREMGLGEDWLEEDLGPLDGRARCLDRDDKGLKTSLQSVMAREAATEISPVIT